MGRLRHSIVVALIVLVMFSLYARIQLDEQKRILEKKAELEFFGSSDIENDPEIKELLDNKTSLSHMAYLTIKKIKEGPEIEGNITPYKENKILFCPEFAFFINMENARRLAYIKSLYSNNSFYRNVYLSISRCSMNSTGPCSSEEVFTKSIRYALQQASCILIVNK